jgi:hypothetical protein
MIWLRRQSLEYRWPQGTAVFFFEGIDGIRQKAEGLGRSEADGLKAKKPGRHADQEERD